MLRRGRARDARHRGRRRRSSRATRSEWWRASGVSAVLVLVRWAASWIAAPTYSERHRVVPWGPTAAPTASRKLGSVFVVAISVAVAITDTLLPMQFAT